MRTRSAFLLVLFSLALAGGGLFFAAPAHSYLPQFTASNAQKWSTSSFLIQWNINPSIGSNVSGSVPVTTVINNSFATWLGAPNTALSATQGASSSVTSESSSPNDVNLICFVCSDVDFGGGTDTLAETITTTTNGAGGDDYHGGSTQFAGQIIKADIAFNPAVQFDTGGVPARTCRLWPLTRWDTSSGWITRP